MQSIDIHVWLEHMVLDVATWETKVDNLILKHQRKASLIQISHWEIKGCQVIKGQDVHIIIPGKPCRFLSVHQCLSGRVCFRKHSLRIKTEQPPPKKNNNKLRVLTKFFNQKGVLIIFKIHISYIFKRW